MSIMSFGASSMSLLMTGMWPFAAAPENANKARALSMSVMSAGASSMSLSMTGMWPFAAAPQNP
jgi:hypothetical protein